MANSAFSKIVKSLWVLLAFIPVINGLGFAYIGAKEFNGNWIKEGLVYEIPWFLLFLFSYNESIGTFFAGIGLLFMLICIIRTFMVYFQNRDVLIYDDPESKVEMNKSFSSYWVIFSLIMLLNGVGLIIIGYRRNVKQWIMEGLFFEFLWIFWLFCISPFFSDTVSEFFIGVAFIGLILSIVRTFMIYFEEEKMDDENYSTLKNILDAPIDSSQKTDEKINSNIIPQFRAYENEINELKGTFDQKEENITGLIEKRFEKEELSYDRFMDVINNCHKLFYHQADSALSIINLAPEYSLRLDESVKGKIYILKSIIEEMNNLIEEFILLEGSDEESEEDLKELFVNMDNLIGSVKDYK